MEQGDQTFEKNVEMKNYSFHIIEAYDDFMINISKVSIKTYKDETLSGVMNQLHDFGLNLTPNSEARLKNVYKIK